MVILPDTEETVSTICIDCEGMFWQYPDECRERCEECDQPDCIICDTVRGCVCDAEYDAWRDDQLERGEW